jgi:hypothetical protein
MAEMNALKKAERKDGTWDESKEGIEEGRTKRMKRKKGGIHMKGDRDI